MRRKRWAATRSLPATSTAASTFHKVLNADKLHKEKVKDLYNYDCLRANKSTMAWGLEERVLFLDRDSLSMP